MKKLRLITMLSAFTLAAAGALGLANLKEGKKAESVSAFNSISIKGQFNSWADAAMTWSSSEGKYIYSGTFSANQEFGFTIDGEWQGYNGDCWTYGWQLVGSNGGSNFKFLIGGQFTIGVDSNKNVSAWFTSTEKVYIERSDVTNAHVFKGDVGKTSWPGVSVFTEEDAYYRSGTKATIKYVTVDASWTDVDTVIFNNGNGGSQTNNLSLEANAVYTSAGAWNAYSKDTNCTNALDFIRYWRTLRSGGSICGHYNDASKKAALVSRYDNLGSTAKALVDGVSDYNDSYGEHTIGDTMAYFKGIQPSGLRIALGNDQEKSQSIVLIIAVSLLSVSAIGGYFFIKRRQEN